MKVSVSNNIIRTIKIGAAPGSLNSTAPVALRNQITELRSIEDIADVSEVEVVNGATLVYNAALDKYEIKPLDLSTIVAELDGGTF